MVDRNKTKNIQMKGDEKGIRKKEKGITLIALIITIIIVLNCSYLAMERMLRREPILQII